MALSDLPACTLQVASMTSRDRKADGKVMSLSSADRPDEIMMMNKHHWFIRLVGVL